MLSPQAGMNTNMGSVRRACSSACLCPVFTNDLCI